jgi:hypothetical protein
MFMGFDSATLKSKTSPRLIKRQLPKRIASTIYSLDALSDPTALRAAHTAALKRKGSANRSNDNKLAGNCPNPVPFFRRR